ncbi:MAG: THUMP domain-containing protein [Thaumarchaeota archaeon]|nr:THUMP domain-containing protein [Nitrososphaerota archaeon]MCL5317367.1 THUMP domain-containing protein [Nitrososphaerota archaeon]
MLKEFGDDQPLVKRTIAKGLSGVKTRLNNRDVIRSLKEKFSADPLSLEFTLKWTPIDRWCESTLESMGQVLSSLRSEIKSGERWMMHIEKRRYTVYHKAEIIKELAKLIDEKVDLKSPNKIVWIDIVGNQAGISVIRPDDIFSLSRMRRGVNSPEPLKHIARQAN